MSVIVYFFPGTFPEEHKFLLGLGVHGEKAQGSDSAYSNKINYISFQVGGEIGFKINDPNWLSVYSIISFNYSPSTMYKNYLIINGCAVTESLKINKTHLKIKNIKAADL
ncbi:hypothetical protein [Fluviispira vulneris]|uniref:hypothetical protein n=1 Tax=Fluviispira vulneris TaxID=2763012 RepID=UPI001648BD2B|nr:hypothetical protein [Fluviispira vulneris]